MFQRTNYQGTNRGASAPRSRPRPRSPRIRPDWLIELQPDQDPQPEDLLRPQDQLLRGHLLPRPRGRLRRLLPHIDIDDNMHRTDSSGYFFYADRARFGTNASLTHYAEDFLAGSHEFKFGAEFERSMARSRYGYTGTGGELGDNVKYWDYISDGYTGPTWPTSTRATTRTPATPGSRPSSRTPGRSRSGSTSASASATARTGATSRASAAPSSDRTGWPPPGLHLRHPGRQDDRPQGPLRPVHRGHADGLPRQDEPGRELRRLRRLLLGPRGRRSGSRCSASLHDALHDGPEHQAPLHGPVHGRHRARALQGHLVRRDLHQPEVERTSSAATTRAADYTPDDGLPRPSLDQDFTVYERTEEHARDVTDAHHQPSRWTPSVPLDPR
ncbi:MAG: hypothetical protein MZU79_04045 [Anaerotruncus sp.]|nr:hypothetical protein [Anaerotruncus sp.]